MPGDYVYSLLGLMHPPSQIVPDYNKPLHELFTEVIVEGLESDPSDLNFLPAAAMHSTLMAGPWWAVDLTTMDHWFSSIWNLYTPTVRLEKRINVCPWAGRFHVRAHFVDEIAETYQLPQVSLPPIDSLTVTVIKESESPFRDDYFASNDHPTGGSWREAWCRTLIADIRIVQWYPSWVSTADLAHFT